MVAAKKPARAKPAKSHPGYRDASGKTNIEKWNDKNRGKKRVFKTVEEWAGIVKTREDALQDRRRSLWAGVCFGISLGLILGYLIILFYGGPLSLAILNI